MPKVRAGLNRMHLFNRLSDNIYPETDKDP